MNLELQITKGQRAGYRKILSGPEKILIGRDATCDLAIPDPLLSRQHCLIEIMAGGVKIIDLKSRNGTFVNGQRILEKELTLQDEIKVGRHTIFRLARNDGNASAAVGACAECGIQISEQDVAQNRAFRHGSQLYCQKCIEQGVEAKPRRVIPQDMFRETQQDFQVPTVQNSPPSLQNPVSPVVQGRTTGHHVQQRNQQVQQRPNLPPGAVSKIGAYEVLGVLGEGGMGFVYKARHTYLETIVAIKVIKDEFASEPRIVKRFLQEAQLGSSLDHPNILRIHDAGESDGMFFISMECFDGDDMSKMVKNHGPFTPPVLIKLAIQMADAIAHAHQHGVIHRDVKPSNILVDKKGLVKLADFGLAKAREKAGQLTASGQMLGTIQYISPEQLEDARSVSPQTDIFSLGACIYFGLTGFPPFGEEPPGKVIENILHNDPPSLTKIVANVPPQLEQICLKAMAKKSKDRYKTMVDVRNALAGLSNL